MDKIAIKLLLHILNTGCDGKHYPPFFIFIEISINCASFILLSASEEFLIHIICMIEIVFPQIRLLKVTPKLLLNDA